MSSSFSVKDIIDHHRANIEITNMGNSVQINSGLVLAVATDLPHILFPAQTISTNIDTAMPIEANNRGTPTKGIMEPIKATDEA